MQRPELATCCVLVVALLAAPATAAAEAAGTLLEREEARAWRGVGRVNVGGLSTRGFCTGVLIAPDLVLTAAHCVVSARTGNPYRAATVHFVAGWHRGAMTGHGNAAAIAIHPFYRPGIRETPFDIAADVALIRLAEALTGSAAEPFEVAAPPPPTSPVVVVSYRRDRAHALTYQDDCGYDALETPLLLLDCAVTKGSSGAPVFADFAGVPRVIAVLVAVISEPESGRAIAVRADTAVTKLLELLVAPESTSLTR